MSPAVALIGAGELTERLTILTATPVTRRVTSLVRSGSTVTVTTPVAHGYATGDFVLHTGATPADYNGEVQVTVLSATTYTFEVEDAPATPGAGTITTTFVSDAQGGGHGVADGGWYTLATIWGKVRALPGRLGAAEDSAVKAVQAIQQYTAIVFTRGDVTPKMRVLWRPFRFPAEKTLEIHGVVPHEEEPRRLMVVHMGEVL